MPRETANAVPSRIPALDGTAQRLLACWDAHLAARGVIHPEAEDFEAFGSLSRLERLMKVLNLVRPLQAGPMRMALKAKRSRKWRKDHPDPETPKNRKPRRVARHSIPETELPRGWRRALGDMRRLRATAADGLVSLDDRNPPSAKVITNLASTSRVFAKVCVDHGCPIEVSRETIDLWRAARFREGNINRTIASRMKELRTFALWCDLDDDVIAHLTNLKNRYERAGRKEPKKKEKWILSADAEVQDVWVKAEDLLEMATGAPVGSALRAALVLDAACLALSVVCPLRCGDLHRICFETHLRRHADYWSLEIETEKTGYEYVRSELWPELTPFLDAVVMLDMPACDFRDAYARKEGLPIFSRDGGRSEPHVSWPTRCWHRHFGIGEHVIRTLWHTMMFASEDDDQWIALAICGQGNGRTAMEYIVRGNRKRASRRARAKLRTHRQNMLSRGVR